MPAIVFVLLQCSVRFARDYLLSCPDLSAVVNLIVLNPATLYIIREALHMVQAKAQILLIATPWVIDFIKENPTLLDYVSIGLSID